MSDFAQGFTVSTTIAMADWRAYTQAYERRLTTARRRTVDAALILLWVAVGFCAAWIAAARGTRFHITEFSIGLLAALIAITLRTRLLRQLAVPDPQGTFLGPMQIDVGVEGIRLRRTHTDALSRWPLLREITATSEHLFLWVDRVAAHIIPVRDLPAGIDPNRAVERIRELAKAGGAPVLQPGPILTTQPPANSEPTLLSSLNAALQLYAFRPLAGGHASPNQGAVFMLGLIAIATWVLCDRYSQGGSPPFVVAGLTGIAWYVLAALAVAWLMAARCTPAVSLRTTAWIVAAVAPLLVAGLWFSSMATTDRGAWGTVLVALVLVLVYVARALRAATGSRQTSALILAAAASLLIALISDAAFVNASVWSGDPTEATADDFADGESLLFDQPAMIDAAVARLVAPAGTDPAAYFVGFAGVGEEHVFAQEISLASRVLGRRYGATNRTVLLINDRDDRESHPLATVSGLERTLRGLGERMNLQRDVLFLVLSSHGSDEPALAVSNGALPLDQLDGEALAAALKDSGIKWKVIIISACYAGAFIAPLQDEHTIILTAAAADRTSFGCGSDRDLTYFGEAFFRDALPQAATLKEAFDKASIALAARERVEHETPSNPQAFYGKAMMAKLMSLEHRTAPSTASRR